MIQLLTEAFKQAQTDTDIRSVLLTGNGKSFCAGANLAWMQSMVNYSLDENLSDSLELFEMFEAAYQCSVPIVGSIQGHVFGGGLGLVAICDFVGAENQTKFCFSEVNLGLVPAVISPFVMKKLRPIQASEWMLSGRVFSAEQALSAGLVSFLGDAGAVQESIQKILKHINASGPQAVRETKKLLRFNLENDWGAIKEQTTQIIAQRRVSQEGQEGLKSFFEKRDPDWKIIP